MQWWVAVAGACVGLPAWPAAERLALWSTGTAAGRPRTLERVSLAIALAVALAAVCGRVGLKAALLAYVVFAIVGVALAAVDLSCHRLPDRLTLPSYVVGFVLLAVAAAIDARWLDLLRAVAAAAAMFGGYLVLHLASPRQLGRGDVKLAGVIGLYLGWLGWSTVAVGALGAFVIGGVVSFGLLVARRASLRTHVAFGPSMIVGALLAIALGPAINDGLLLWTA